MELGQKVKIKAIEVEGVVVGIWHSLYAETRYNIRYYDTTKRQAEDWFIKTEIETAE